MFVKTYINNCKIKLNIGFIIDYNFNMHNFNILIKYSTKKFNKIYITLKCEL